MSDSAAPQPEVRKTPFWRTLFESVLFVLTNLPALVKIGWAPFIVSAVASYVTFAQIMGAATISPVIRFLVSLLSLFAYAVFGVGWHRFVILGESRGTPEEWFAGRCFLFYGYVLLFGGGIMLVFNLFNPLLTPGADQSPGFLVVISLFTVLYMVAFFVMVRLYLMFPATAIDRPLGLGEAWRRMRGNTWRLIFAMFVLGLAATLPTLPFSLAMGEMMEAAANARAHGELIDASMPIYAYVTPFIGFVIGAMAVTMLSKIYLHVIGPPQAGQGAGT